MVVENDYLLDSVAFYLASSTGGGSIDLIAPVEAEDSEVHWYKDEAHIVGITILKDEGAAQLKDVVTVNNNLFKQSEGLSLPIMGDTILPGGQTFWLPIPMKVEPDSDFTVTAALVTASQSVMVILHILYGPLPRGIVGGVSMVGYQKTLAAGVAGVWAKGGTISDLDPDSIYAIMGVFAASATHLAGRLRADSFKGTTPGWGGKETTAIGQGSIMMYPYPMKFSGRETLIIDQFNKSTDAAEIWLLLSEVSEGVAVKSGVKSQKQGKRPGLFMLS